MVKRDLKFGNDIFKTIVLEEQGIDFELMYWDLWIIISLHTLFNNQWTDLINAIIKNSTTSNRYCCESMLSHIKYLREKLLQYNIDYRDIISCIDEVTIKKQFTEWIQHVDYGRNYSIGLFVKPNYQCTTFYSTNYCFT